jgi:hypothetical protein
MKKSEIFAGQLKGGTREFFLRMNEILENEGLIIRHGDKRITNRVTYFPDTNRKQPLELKKQQPLVLRYTIEENGGLTVDLKLNFMYCYTDIIEKMPEHIKGVFRHINQCRLYKCHMFDRESDHKCGMRRTWTIDGKHFYLCSYDYYFHPDISNSDDVEYYAKIIKAEVSAAKARKKHNTAYYG